MQAVVPILPDDTAESLHERIQVQEHRILPVSDRFSGEIGSVETDFPTPCENTGKKTKIKRNNKHTPQQLRQKLFCWMDKLVILKQMGKILFGHLVISFLLWEVRPIKFLSAILEINKSRRSTTGF
jgi:hypothetical protein